MLGSSLGSPPWEIVNEFWSKKVPAQSGGKIATDVQSVRELGLKGPEAVRMINRGVVNMLDEAMGFYSGDIPESDGMDLAGLAADLGILNKAVNAYEPTLAALYKQRMGAKCSDSGHSPARFSGAIPRSPAWRASRARRFVCSLRQWLTL